MNHWISVAVQTPAHSSVAGPLTYRSELPLPPGTLVRAPLGSREVLGIVWSPADGPPDGRAAEATRPIASSQVHSCQGSVILSRIIGVRMRSRWLA